MIADEALSHRKSDHIEAVLSGAGHAHTAATGFERIQFEHCALPELDLAAIDLSTTFLGRPLKSPLMISSMTGGPDRAAIINRHLAEAAEAHGIPFAVGSQRIAIEGGPAHGIGDKLRRIAPTIPIYANFGAAQLGRGFGQDEARRAIDMIGADALILHLNPLQEAIQVGGDRDWSGILARVADLARCLAVPVIVKEVGFGISAAVAKALLECGIAAIDVAGSGGTNWALVEGARRSGEREQRVAADFAQWGIPTATALVQVRSRYPNIPLIASGGIRSGVDAAKAIRLGADIVASAAGLLDAALQSAPTVYDRLAEMIQQIRIVCFVTGSPSLAALRCAKLLSPS